MALQAGASGLSFTPVPGLIGSDLMRVRDDFRTIANPFAPDERVAVIPAINPDFALVHALRAAPDGTLVIPASGDAALLIRASRTVIATAETVTDGPVEVLRADEQLVPGIYVDAVAVAPRGAHPLGCPGWYGVDEEHTRAYVDAARDAARFAAYVKTFILEPAGAEAYLERAVGEGRVAPHV
jgi:glutaconate CoA-transferase subunit A